MSPTEEEMEAFLFMFQMICKSQLRNFHSQQGIVFLM